jgi:hypothetical protein
MQLCILIVAILVFLDGSRAQGGTIIHNRGATGNFVMSPRSWDDLKAQGVTVMLNTYKRPDKLRSAVEHYNACPVVETVRVIWCEPGQPPSTKKW